MKKSRKKYFTERQSQIVELCLLGKESIEIAKELYVSKRTIEAHISQMLAKFYMPNRVALCFYYLLTHDEISASLIDDFMKEHPYPFAFLTHSQLNYISGYNRFIKRTED